MTNVSKFESEKRLPAVEVLGTLSKLRGDDQVVVTHQGSARLWPQVADHPLDFHYNPSTMGGAVSFGLGIAIAQPSRGVLVISGDGSLLMNLGSLVTVVAAKTPNLSIVVLDNGTYEVTGGQKTAAELARLDFAKMAESIGFVTALNIDKAADHEKQLERFLKSQGPRFASIAVESAQLTGLAKTPLPIQAQITRLTKALQP